VFPPVASFDQNRIAKNPVIKFVVRFKRNDSSRRRHIRENPVTGSRLERFPAHSAEYSLLFRGSQWAIARGT
jgi:hypothetical protein